MPLLFVVYPDIYPIYLNALYLSCFLTGCLLVRKSWPLEYKLLIVLSGLTILVEMTIYINRVHGIDSRGIYNFFAPAECGFIIYILYRASAHPAIKRLNAVLLGFLPISIGIAYYMHPVFTRFNDSAGLFYDFLELIAACSFLIDFLLNQSVISLGRQPFFWTASGLLFACSLFTLQDVLMNYIPTIPNQYLTIYSTIANSFMYAGFIACFICLRSTDRQRSPA